MSFPSILAQAHNTLFPPVIPSALFYTPHQSLPCAKGGGTAKP